MVFSREVKFLIKSLYNA